MTKFNLINGKLLVKGEMTDIFEVSILNVRKDMIVDVLLTPNDYTSQNGVEEIQTSFDPLNETLVELLKSEGFMVIKENQVKMIQN